MKVVVNEADYGQAVEKQLRDYKRKANVPGFRPGMVPMGIVKMASMLLLSSHTTSHQTQYSSTCRRRTSTM